MNELLHPRHSGQAKRDPAREADAMRLSMLETAMHVEQMTGCRIKSGMTVLSFGSVN